MKRLAEAALILTNAGKNIFPSSFPYFFLPPQTFFPVIYKHLAVGIDGR